jgi:predicted nucleotidyltransferase
VRGKDLHDAATIMTTITERKDLLEKSLERIVALLIKEYRPEKIILFGSLATGEVSEVSDLDLLIVKDSPLPFYDRLREVALLCPLEVGADLLVYTPDEVEQASRENRFFREEVLGKGRVVYHAPA